ncbi:MAG: hypothetical protein J5I92_15225 [Thiogranum sp.]|nr:hypothetical protein [Thiogranum sp.]
MCNKEDHPIPIEVSLIDSVAKSNLQSLAMDAAELTIDAVLTDELMKSIPVVSTVANLYRATVSIRDRIFLRKVLSFLTEFLGIPEEDRKRFADELDENAGTRAKAGASLVLLLERLDDLDKPELVGRLYRAKLEGRLSFEELRRFCMIVERAHLPDLAALSKLRLGEEVDPVAAPYLLALGLLTVTGEDYNYEGIGASTRYEVNRLGSNFLDIAFPKHNT